MKKILKKIYSFFSKIFLSAFYNRKKFRGKYFENGNVQGYKWAWKNLYKQKIKGYNKNCDWPVSSQIRISDGNNLIFDMDDLNNFQHFGCYYQNFSAKIFLGKGTYIAPNVGIITSNHDINNLDKHQPGKDVIIGKKCWIGMNSVILPGVKLGDNTIVGAGSIVTKSFSEGNCIIAGNPAKIIKKLDGDKK